VNEFFVSVMRESDDFVRLEDKSWYLHLPESIASVRLNERF